MKKFLLGMLVGVIGGAVIGVLFAPSSGEETRKKIKQVASDISQKIADQIMATGKFSREKYNQIVSRVLNKYNDEEIPSVDKEEMLEELKDKYDRIREILGE